MALVVELPVVQSGDVQSVAKRSELVALVRPPRVSSPGSWSAQLIAPIGLAYLASMLREAGHRVMAVDAIGEAQEQLLKADGYLFQGLTPDELVERIDPESTIIGVSCMFTQDWPSSRRVIQDVRRRFPHALIVAGGEHITACDEFCLRDCPELDICARGEGEETIVELANAFQGRDRLESLSGVSGISWIRDGVYQRTAPRQRIREVDQIPRPSWDLFPMEAYLGSTSTFGVYRGRSLGILATRGCPYKCTFCSNPGMYGNLWVARSPADVVDEIQDYVNRFRIDNVDFLDLTMVVRRRWILEFCQLLEERGLKLTWQLPSGTRSEMLDAEVAQALFRTGCRNLALAPESGSPEVLQTVKKQLQLPNVLRAARACAQNGIHLRINIVIGFPDETRRQILQTIWFVWKLACVGAEDCEFAVFSPYPGTELFDRLRADGVIQDLDDDYFRSLTSSKNFGTAASYCQRISSRELHFWRLLGMLTFYLLTIIRQPLRPFKVLWRLLVNRNRETVLDNRLSEMLHRPRAKEVPVSVVVRAESSLPASGGQLEHAAL